MVGQWSLLAHILLGKASSLMLANKTTLREADYDINKLNDRLVEIYRELLDNVRIGSNELGNRLHMPLRE